MNLKNRRAMSILTIEQKRTKDFRCVRYAMLRYQEAISIYKSFLFDSPMSEIVKERINGNSKYFEITDKEIIKRRSGYYNIGIYFTKYQRKEHKQYIYGSV